METGKILFLSGFSIACIRNDAFILNNMKNKNAQEKNADIDDIDKIILGILPFSTINISKADILIEIFCYLIESFREKSFHDKKSEKPLYKSELL